MNKDFLDKYKKITQKIYFRRILLIIMLCITAAYYFMFGPLSSVFVFMIFMVVYLYDNNQRKKEGL